MEKETVSKEQINDIITWFLYSVECIESYRLIHKYYCDNRVDWYNKFAIAPGFVHYTNRAVQHGLMAELMRLFDNDGKSITINFLCSECYKHSEFFHPGIKDENGAVHEFNVQEVVRQYQREKKGYSSALSNLHEQRNKIWAHTDVKYAGKPFDAESDFPVSWGEIEDIIAITRDFLTLLEAGLNGEYKHHKFASGEDILYLFNAIPDDYFEKNHKSIPQIVSCPQLRLEINSE